jgi:hypothetical protein
MVFAALCALGAAPARAQDGFVGVRALGMGEARRAIATGAEGILYNPAGMSLTKGYSIEAIYGFSVEDLGHHVNVSVVDSITSRVAAGLFYTFIYTSPKVGFNWAGGTVEQATLNRQGHATGLALSLPLGDKFILGAAVKYYHFDTIAPLPVVAGVAPVPPNLTLDTVNGVTFDVALLFRVAEKFHVTAVGQNLWDHGSRETPLTLGIGLAVIPVKVFTITFDTAINFTGFRNLVGLDPMTGQAQTTARIAARLGPGLEFVAGGKVPIRAGVVYDSGLSSTYLTAGLGYISPQFGADLSYRGKVAGGLENTLALSLRIFVN